MNYASCATHIRVKLMGTNQSCCRCSVTPTDTSPTDTNLVNTNQSLPRSIGPTDINPMGSNQSLPLPRPVSPTDTNLVNSNQSLPRSIGPTDTNPMGSNQSPRSIGPTDTNPMGSNQSLPGRPPVSPTDTNPTDTKQSRPIPNIQFRVLIIGRANAGKTTILQRVCDSTESPTIYRIIGDTREEVRYSGLVMVLPVLTYTTQVSLDPSMEVGDKICCPLSPFNSESAWRTRNRGRTGVLQPYGLYFSRFTWYRVR